MRGTRMTGHDEARRTAANVAELRELLARKN